MLAVPLPGEKPAAVLFPHGLIGLGQYGLGSEEVERTSREERPVHSLEPDLLIDFPR
jgi:hypothetical protein